MVDWKNKRDRDKDRALEDEKEKEFRSDKARKFGITTPGPNGGPAASSGDAQDSLADSIHKAEVLLDQVNNLYSQYFSGAERVAPQAQRAQLERLVSAITVAPKSTAAHRFQGANILSRFATYRERWDKMLKDLEAGRIKRPGGVKK